MKRIIVASILCMVLLLAVTTVWANPYKAKEVSDQIKTTDIAPPAGPVTLYPPMDDQWDVLFFTNAGQTTGDNQLLGVEYAGGFFWATGGNAGVDPNKIYKIDNGGNLVGTYDQPAAATGWGFRDLVWDGTYLYGSPDNGTVYAFDLTGTMVPGSNINGPEGPNRALAYDPATDHFWTQNFSGPIYEFDRTGVVSYTGPSGAPAAYGMAWDDVDPAGPWLWIHCQAPDPGGPNGCTIYQYDPVAHILTGVTYNVPYIGGSTAQLAGGLAFTDEFDPTFWTMVGMTQGTPDDLIFVQEMYDAAPGGSPAAPSAFTVSDNGATLMASLDWTNPTLTVSGQALTSIDSVVIKRDDVFLIAFTAVTPGQVMSHDDATIPAAGTYDYSVYCTNDSGAGIPANGSAWIGPDVPFNVTDLLMTPGANFQMEATLTWINPTSGAHGGFYPGITGYTIFRDSDEGHTATFDLPGTHTSYLDETIPDPDYYWYDVTAYNASGDGFTATSNTGWVGIPEIWTWEEITYDWFDISGVGTFIPFTDDSNLGPYSLGFTFTFFGLDFDSIRACSNGFLSFTSTSPSLSNTNIPNSLDPNNLIAMFWDDLDPPEGQGACYYYEDTTNDRWIIQFTNVEHFPSLNPETFQCILDEDGTIEVHYMTVSTNASCTVGIEDDSGTEGIEVWYNGAGQFAPVNNSAIRFNPPVTGVAGQPGIVTDLVGIVGELGALSCSLSWVNPAIDALGQPLADTSLVGIKIVRDAAIIADLTPAVVGAPMSYMDSPIPAAGLYEYTVYGYNNTYDGLTNTLDPLWVGEDVPGAVTTLWMEPDPGMAFEATLTWVNPTAGAHGGYFTTIQGYHIERSDGVILELVGEDTIYVDSTVPGSDYYYYIVTPYNASGDGTSATSNTAYVGPPQIYTWETLPYVWNDISTIGTNSGLSGDDQNVGPFNMGFSFEFYETFFSSIRLCSNGWQSFTSTAITYTNQAIPTSAEPNNLVAPFWDDLTLSSGTVYYYADPVEHTFTIQFDNVPHLVIGGPYTFQTVIKQDGTIEFYYNTIGTYNTSCTVGVENSTGTEGLEVNFNGAGNFIPEDNTAIRINPPFTGFGQVSGTVTLDGAVGDITDVLITGNFGAETYCNSNGDYLLDSARAGDNYITASMDSFFYDSTQMVAVPLDTIIENVDFTLRRLEPSIPTGLAAVVDTATGAVTLTWDLHPDPTVDIYLLQRKFASEQWMALTIVPHIPPIPPSYVDNLPEEGQWFYRIACTDLNVLPPPSQSAFSEELEVIWGELPPINLTANGNYDDRIRLRWVAPGGSPNPPLSIIYDDGTSETWFRVIDPSGNHDYFAVRFSFPPEPEMIPPIHFRYASFLAERADPYPLVMACEDLNGVPDIDNPLDEVFNVSAPAAADWAIVEWNDLYLESTDDFWVVVQFPPGQIGPGMGADISSPDLRSYWYYDIEPWWHLWTTHDWMIRSYLGAEEDGRLLSLGPSGSEYAELPVGSTAESLAPVSTKEKAVGPRRVEREVTRSFSYVAPQLTWNTRNQAGRTLDASRSIARDETDQLLLYYMIYRDNVYIDTSYSTEYFDIGLVENVLHEYYVTAYYDNGQESGTSNSDTARCNMAPGPPTNFFGTANATEDSMVLTWDDPTVNMDGSPCVDLDELTLYRDGTFIADVQPGVETYTNGVPNPTMTYTWTIVAKDEVPNEGEAASFTGGVQSPWNVIPYFWNDITGVGTPLTIGDDENLGPFNIGFDYTYYGNTYSTIRICSNGFLTFTSTSATLSNSSLPSTPEPNNTIAAFWDDLNPASGGTVHYYYDSGPGWFIVQFTGVPHYGTGGANTFQWILTSDNAVYINFNTLSPPLNEATCGVENADGTVGIELNYNGVGPYQFANQTSVSFWGGPPPEGDLEGYVREAEDDDPIEDAMVVCGEDTAYTDATGFYEMLGILTGHYTVTASKFGYNSESDTVTIVEGQTHTMNFFLPQPIIGLDVTSITVAMAAGTTQDETFNISNTGDGTLDFNIELIETDAGIEIAPSQGSRTMPVQVASDSRSTKTRSVETRSTSVGPVRFHSLGLDETDEPWATISPLQGTVDPGDAQLITVTFEVPDTSQIGDIWEADLIIHNNTINPEVTIPLQVTVVDFVPEEELLPLEYALYQNYPNPFNPMTRIRFDLRERSNVMLEVYNIMGRKVTTVINRTMDAGRYTAEFDGTMLASGLYFYRISANDFQDLKKMVLIK